MRGRLLRRKGNIRKEAVSEAVRMETEAESQSAWNKKGVCRAGRNCLTTLLALPSI